MRVELFVLPESAKKVNFSLVALLAPPLYARSRLIELLIRLLLLLRCLIASPLLIYG